MLTRLSSEDGFPLPDFIMIGCGATGYLSLMSSESSVSPTTRISCLASCINVFASVLVREGMTGFAFEFFEIVNVDLVLRGEQGRGLHGSVP